MLAVFKLPNCVYYRAVPDMSFAERAENAPRRAPGTTRGGVWASSLIERARVSLLLCVPGRLRSAATRTAAATAGLLLAALIGAPIGFAQATEGDACGEVSTLAPLEFTPVNGSSAVARNAHLRVRYPEDYFDVPAAGDPTDALSLVRCDSPDFLAPCNPVESVMGTITLQEDTVVFAPDALLLPQTRYEYTASAIDVAPRVGAFRTLDGVDTTPPVFFGVDSVDSARVRPSCEAPDGGYRIDLFVNPAQDDFSPGDIEYLVYLTRAEGLGAPQLRSRVRNYQVGRGEIALAFVLEAEYGVRPVCVEVVAVDGVGLTTAESSATCFDPATGDFFAPLCATTPSGVRTSPGGVLTWGSFGLLGVLLLRRRRRARLPR